MCELAILSLEDCNKILSNSLKSDKYEIETYYFLSFHNPLQGLIGEHSTLKIEYNEENTKEAKEFFVKNISSNPLMSKFSKEIKVYEKESFFYNLLHEFDKYNIDTSFAPNGYFFKPYVVVLEDLSKTGYKGTPKRQFLDLDHCKTCLKTLSKFHAASIAYEKRKSKELGQKFSLIDANFDVLEDKFSVQEDTMATKWMRCSVEGLFQLIDLIPENYITHDNFKAKLAELLTVEKSGESLISAVVHGDLWSSNFLYLYAGDKPDQCKLLDYQTLKYGSVELDIVEFLMTNTSRSFREKNFTKLVEFYFENLKESLIKAGLECDEISIATCEDFVHSCDNFKLAGKVHAIADHSYTFMSDEIYRDAMKSEESFQRFFFDERGKYVVECCNKNEEFKNALYEDVLELRDLLFS